MVLCNNVTIRVSHMKRHYVFCKLKKTRNIFPQKIRAYFLTFAHKTRAYNTPHNLCTVVTISRLMERLFCEKMTMSSFQVDVF